MNLVNDLKSRLIKTIATPGLDFGSFKDDKEQASELLAITNDFVSILINPKLDDNLKYFLNQRLKIIKNIVLHKDGRSVSHIVGNSKSISETASNLLNVLEEFGDGISRSLSPDIENISKFSKKTNNLNEDRNNITDRDGSALADKVGPSLFSEKVKIDSWIGSAAAQGHDSFRGYEIVKGKIQSLIFNDKHFNNQINRENYDEMVVYASEQIKLFEEDKKKSDIPVKWEDWLRKREKEKVDKVIKFITEAEFLSDALSKEDYIGGRKEFSKILATKITNIFESEKHEGSFTLHLEGKWGSGKSTFIEYLRHDLNSTEKWMVVDFDSWRYQHFIPTWWGFLEQIKLGILSQTDCKSEKLKLKFYLFAYRIRKIMGFSFVVGLTTTAFTICTIYNKPSNLLLIYTLGGISLLALIKPIIEFYNSSIFFKCPKDKKTC